MPNPEDIVVKHHCKVNEDEAVILKKLIAPVSVDSITSGASNFPVMMIEPQLSISCSSVTTEMSSCRATTKCNVFLS